MRKQQPETIHDVILDEQVHGEAEVKSRLAHYCDLITNQRRNTEDLESACYKHKLLSPELIDRMLDLGRITTYFCSCIPIFPKIA